jgi:hypothetical protein
MTKMTSVKVAGVYFGRSILVAMLLWSMHRPTVPSTSPSTAPAELKPPLLGGAGSSGSPVQLPVVPTGATDFALEVSEDLQHWQVARNYHVASANLVTVPDPGPPSEKNRFYRLRIPGDLVADKLTAWKAHGITSYGYHYAPRIGFCNCIVSADLTVNNGVVVNVTNAVRASGDPEPNPNPADFPTINDLFDQITAAEQDSQIAWVGVEYDPVLSFPAEMGLWSNPDLPHGFVVSEFEILP